jgi:hypothetical protein
MHCIIQAVGEILFPKTVHVDTGNGATVSQDHKVNVSASAAVDTEALQSQTKESTILPSSFGTEARISSAPQPATVEPAVEPLSSIRPLSPYPLVLKSCFASFSSIIVYVRFIW